MDLRINHRIFEVINRLFNQNNIPVSQETMLLSDLGLKDQKLIDLIMEVEDLFYIIIPDEQISGFATIGGIISYVHQVKEPI